MKNIFSMLFPTRDCDSTYKINFRKLYKKGYRGIMFDIDNTIVEHDQPVTKRAIKLFKLLHRLGFKTCLISNNKEARIKPLAKKLNCEYVYKAGKPKKFGYLKGMKKMNTNKHNTVFIGDQLFTDIWGANRAGIKSILVKPIAKHEEIQIVLKRILEKPIIALYQRSKEKQLQKLRSFKKVRRK
ncbi:MAG: YqeG family HAD IIIA-type phosphatase [Lachnospiraceae bacterium]|nr:YqeG family HAD IIIA-type phosphatase [Lachnospiraceae bacterium]